jgi:hypothetical protein
MRVSKDSQMAPATSRNRSVIVDSQTVLKPNYLIDNLMTPKAFYGHWLSQ